MAARPRWHPATVKRWLDQGHDDNGRPVVTLDTRNDFEVDEGTFDGAIDWRITKFTEFPDSLPGRTCEQARRRNPWSDFCTGGIRCEKAAILMREVGLERVYELEGGILDAVFEETDGSHYQGEVLLCSTSAGPSVVQICRRRASGAAAATPEQARAAPRGRPAGSAWRAWAAGERGVHRRPGSLSGRSSASHPGGRQRPHAPWSCALRGAPKGSIVAFAGSWAGQRRAANQLCA